MSMSISLILWKICLSRKKKPKVFLKNEIINMAYKGKYVNIFLLSAGACCSIHHSVIITAKVCDE